MKPVLRSLFVLSVILSVTTTTSAHELAVNNDQAAVDVLNAMSTQLASMERFVMVGESFSDAEHEDGLIISNPKRSEVTVDRPGSLFASTFDGVNVTEIYINEGILTVFTSENNFFARQSVPGSLQQALRFSLDELGVETPFLDFLMDDVAGHLLIDNVQALYLSDKSQIRGIDCHHIALRDREYDLQLWIEEGDRPLVRKMLMVSILESGMPRHAAFLDWILPAEIDSEVFEFDTSGDAAEIKFGEVQ